MSFKMTTSLQAKVRSLDESALHAFGPATVKDLPAMSSRVLEILNRRQFLPCDAIAVFAVARFLSVCPSVTLAYCIQTAEDIVKLPS